MRLFSNLCQLDSSKSDSNIYFLFWSWNNFRNHNSSNVLRFEIGRQNNLILHSNWHCVFGVRWTIRCYTYYRSGIVHCTKKVINQKDRVDDLVCTWHNHMTCHISQKWHNTTRTSKWLHTTFLKWIETRTRFIEIACASATVHSQQAQVNRTQFKAVAKFCLQSIYLID